MPPITEKAFQAQIVHLAKRYGYLVFHPLRMQGSTAGYPDLTLVHVTHGILWVELKREDGRLTYAQMEWRDSILAAGGRHFVWKPSDLPEAAKVLSGETT